MARDKSDQPFFNVHFRFENLGKRLHCLLSLFVFIHFANLSICFCCSCNQACARIDATNFRRVEILHD